VGLAVEAYGVRLGLRTNDLGLLPALERLLPPAWSRSSSPVVDRLYSFWAGGAARPGVRRFDLVYDGSRTVIRTLDRTAALNALEQELRLHVAEHSRRFVFVHAGVVEWEGRALLLPGPSRSGKSRLVEELLRRGARYYSDEYAVLDGRGRVHPYPRPLALRARGGGAGRRHVDIPGANVGRDPIPVGLVAMCRYRKGERFRPRSVSPGRGLLAILSSTPPARRQPRRVLQVLNRLLSQAPVVTGWRGEARQTASSLLRGLVAAGQGGGRS
jgi:hypothetical protein